MSDGSRVLPPRQVPTLTEVVEEAAADMRPLMPDDAEDEAAGALEPQRAEPAEASPDALVSDRATEQQFVERILADLQRQIHPLLEQRLRETLAPLVARWSEALIEDSREQLACALRDVVAQAVAREFERQRRR